MENQTQLVTVDPQEYGLQTDKAKEIIGNLPQILSERAVLEPQYDEVIKMDIDSPFTAKAAAELRKLIRNNRTKGIEVWHKTTKEFFLRGGQFVDAVRRKEVAVNERMEEALEQIEKHAEIKEQQRKDALKAERMQLLEGLTEDPAMFPLGEMSEQAWSDLYEGLKAAKEAREAAERKAEEERIRQQEIEALHVERKTALIPIWNFLTPTEQELNFGELDNSQYAEIANGAMDKQAAYELEQEAIRLENERLKAAADAKAKELAKQKAAADAKLKAEREAKEKAEREAQALRDAEAKRLKDIADAEAAEKKAAALAAKKAAKAPDRDKLLNMVNSIHIVSAGCKTEEGIETETEIMAKFASFKKWAVDKINTL